MSSVSPIPEPNSAMSYGTPDDLRTPAPAGTAHFTGHTVVDERGDVIGKVSDVVYGGATGQAPKWLVVDVGLLGVSHYAPAERATLTETGEIVAAFDKRQVKSAPKAHRDHIVTNELEDEISRHYELAR